MGDTRFHLLCADCFTAVEVESFAKRRSMRRRSDCPMCGTSDDGVWRPIIGKATAMRKAVEQTYETYSPSDEAVSPRCSR